MSRVDFRVYLITDRRQAPGGDILRAVEGALDGGIRAVQLREKDLTGKELYLLADRMRELTARHGARLLVNDRVDVALAVGADGVHLGGASMPASAARTLLGEVALIGCSTHSEAELREAVTQGADFATFGPVYPTPSKAAYGPPVGVPALAGACGRSAIPVFALGGIKAENTGEAIGAGAFGIALISGVVAATNPRGAAMDLLTRVENALAIGKAAGGGNKGG
ncbi:MAG: thiamine phosphate synthase [Candidatus Deferrimicrobiaceae bacterium]